MRLVHSRRSEVAASSSARTATGQTAALFPGRGDEVVVMADVTAVSGTTPSMTLSVEWSHDGTNWFEADTADSFTAITAVKKVTKAFTIKGTLYRVKWTITGTTPSFTFSLTAVTGS